MLNYSILLKKISKFENIDVIRDVINSVNDNQLKELNINLKIKN